MKHEKIITGDPPASLDASRRHISGKNRYWSRAHLAKILEETGEITMIGGKSAIRTTNRYSLNSFLRNFGYENVIIYDDDDEYFSGQAYNEPDYESILRVFRKEGTSIIYGYRFNQMLKTHRRIGLIENPDQGE